MKLFVVALVFLSAVGVLVAVGVKASSIPVLKFEQLAGPESTYTSGVLQLDGTVVRSVESVHPLRFRVAPEDSAREPCLVVSKLSPPENFGVGKPVSLRGTYDPGTRTFDAFLITTQCPSRYEAAKEYDKAKNEESAAPAPGRMN